MIVVIDNYDSFTWNLVQLVAGETSEEIRVMRNDDPELGEINDGKLSALIISPGPGRPENAGRSIEIINRMETTPVLGVCLGHQAIAVAMGGKVGLAPTPRHGKPSRIRHTGDGLFSDCDNPIEAIRYHSLLVDRQTLPDELVVTAETEEGLVMGIRHKERPLFGVQFHPESYGSEGGKTMIKNFLEVRDNG